MANLDKASVRVRLYDKVQVDPLTGCHVWTGCWRSDGRGSIRIGATTYATRRVAAWLAGLIELWQPVHVCRKSMCRTPACVNPDHVCVARTPSEAATIVRRTSASYKGRFALTELRAAAVQARLDEGDTIEQVAADLKTRPSRLRRRLDALTGSSGGRVPRSGRDE